MEYTLWAPQYEMIRRAFGFDFAREEIAARRLSELLPPAARVDPLGRIGRRLSGADAIVVGRAPRVGPPPIWRLPPPARRPSLVAADGASAVCLEAGLVPDVIVTDLDGPIPSEVTANRRGSFTVVHAHGDNVPQLEEWVGQFPGELAGSWAGAPTATLIDTGGFTDGDRAAYLACEAGATRVLLWGFDFRTVDHADPRLNERKLKKLEWADRSLRFLAAHAPCPLLKWEPDGTIAPYPSDSAAESTR